VINVFNNNNFPTLCNELGKRDKDLKNIIDQYGFPPLWSRKPDFETLIHIILEQQVSLAAAKAALDKLKLKIGKINPEKLLLLSDEEMRSCYFSRQKTVYSRHLASAIMEKKFSLAKLARLSDEEVRVTMKALKGIGDWTADVFLMMALNRTDCFPTGDIALIKSIKQVKALPGDCSKEEILLIAENWRPYRTIAAYLLWHDYLSRRKKRNNVQKVQESDTMKAK
jgi:DNA-3-methyladenine glycosylase II